MVVIILLRDLEKKNMLDPICTVRQRNKTKMAAKTMVRFCKGDPVLVTGDINGEIDVYRLNRNLFLIQVKKQHSNSINKEIS